MALTLVDCDGATRVLMASEVDFDKPPRQLFISNRLTEAGRREWRLLLVSAINGGDDQTLATSLKHGGYLSTAETATRNGKTFTKAVPVAAAETLAEGEFNRFYIRGLCRRAADLGIVELEIYRAKPVMKPRPESEAKIGTRIDASSLLRDLRDNVGIDTALGVPAGPNSGRTTSICEVTP